MEPAQESGFCGGGQEESRAGRERKRVGWSLPVKAAEQKEKTMKSGQDWEAAVSPDFHKTLPSPKEVCWTVNCLFMQSFACETRPGCFSHGKQSNKSATLLKLY